VDNVSVFPGLYPLGTGQNQSLLNGTFLSSNGLNTSDVFAPAAGPGFPFVGPGSQVWMLGYSIRASRPSPFPAPTTPLGLTLEARGSYDLVVPFIFEFEQQIILPVFAGLNHYSGRFRTESVSGLFVLTNNTGNDLEVSFSFWGKAL
jgi:hypothetical protein